MPFEKRHYSEVSLFLPGLILALIGTSFAMYRLLNPDAAILLEMSEQILAGKRLYQDIVDNQFPAIHLISLFIVLISKTISLSIPNSFFVFIFLLLNSSIFLTWKILKENFLIQNRGNQTWVIIVLYYGLFILPCIPTKIGGSFWDIFGEREHFFAALALPYFALCLNRLNYSQVKQTWCVLSGILAGIGFAIKPHFVLVFIASELFLIYYKKGFLTCLRTESIIILTMLFVYLLGMLLFTPYYFKTVPYFANLLSAIALPWLDLTLIVLFLSLVPLLLLMWFFVEKQLRHDWYFVPYLFALSVAALVMAVLGRHLPNYHVFPFKVITLVLAALMVITHPKKVFFYAFTILLVVMMLQTSQKIEVVQAQRNFTLQVAAKIREYAPNGTVVLLDTAFPFPAITYAEARHGLDTASLWYVPFAYSEYRGKPEPPPYHPPNQMGKTERFFHELVIHNLETEPPQLIILNKARYKFWLGRMRFDFADYLSLDSRFVEIWKNYRWTSQLSDPLSGFQLNFYQRQKR